jgi:hypothetical protein
MTSQLPDNSVAEKLADRIVALKPGGLPAVTARKCEDMLMDVVGLASPRATGTTSEAHWPAGTTMARAL